jgi:hypothetical protein
VLGSSSGIGSPLLVILGIAAKVPILGTVGADASTARGIMGS